MRDPYVNNLVVSAKLLKPSLAPLLSHDCVPSIWAPAAHQVNSVLHNDSFAWFLLHIWSCPFEYITVVVVSQLYILTQNVREFLRYNFNHVRRVYTAFYITWKLEVQVKHKGPSQPWFLSAVVQFLLGLFWCTPHETHYACLQAPWLIQRVWPCM